MRAQLATADELTARAMAQAVKLELIRQSAQGVLDTGCATGSGVALAVKVLAIIDAKAVV